MKNKKLHPWLKSSRRHRFLYTTYIERNAKRWTDVMMISSLRCRAYFSAIPRLNIRMSFRVSSGIASIRRSERYVETYREIDTSMTKNSGWITFAYTVIGDKTCRKVLTAQSMRGSGDGYLFGVRIFSGATPPLAGYNYYVSFSFLPLVK